MKRFGPVGLILLLASVLYIPTLQTGFLTDGFLDSETTIQDLPAAFTSMVSSGYRPLMSFSWAIDNMVWGTEKRFGWHLTNIVILLTALYVFYRFLHLFVKCKIAIISSLVFFAISLPVASAVSRVVWRTSLLPLIPLYIALILAYRWGEAPGKPWHIVFSSVFFLSSLFLKELALTAPPVFAATVLYSSHGDRKWKNTITIFTLTSLMVLLYIVVRYSVIGLSVGYNDSLSFGYFMLKNILFLLASTCDPWLSAIPAKVLFPLFTLFIWYILANFRQRVLVVAMAVFLLLPVSNLAMRPDYAVAGVPAVALALGFAVERYHGKKHLLPILAVLFLAVFIRSRDETKIIADASGYVERTSARLGEIAEELPGNGPLFISGVDRTVGTYGTFWPGEYMAPMKCLGITPDRLVTGTDRIWEGLITEGEGFLVFMNENGMHYRWTPVSVDMYEELPDTVLLLSGLTKAGELARYPSCTIQGEPGPLYLLSSIHPDSLVVVLPEILNGEAVYDLAAEPVWLASDGGVVLLVDNHQEFVFSSRNVAILRAAESLEAKAFCISHNQVVGASPNHTD